MFFLLVLRFGDGYILLGFSGGFFVVISTHLKEIGQELFQAKNHKDSLTDIAISISLSKAASCGDNVWVLQLMMESKNSIIYIFCAIYQYISYIIVELVSRTVSLSQYQDPWTRRLEGDICCHYTGWWAWPAVAWVVWWWAVACCCYTFRYRSPK